MLPDDDELVKGTRLTSGGKVVHERLGSGLGQPAEIDPAASDQIEQALGRHPH